MSKFQFSNKAVEDLTEIHDYTTYKWSEQQADKYYFEIIEAVKTISNSQRIGRIYNMIRNDIFGFPLGRHIIFYRIINDDLIEVERIIGAEMDIKRQF